jgi:hypothetical protein
MWHFSKYEAYDNVFIPFTRKKEGRQLVGNDTLHDEEGRNLLQETKKTNTNEPSLRTQSSV